MAVTTKTNVEKYLKKSIPAADEDWVDTLISAVEQYIKNHTGLVFEIDDDASARYYDTDGERKVHIDSCSEVTVVAIVDSYGDVTDTIEDTDYHTYALNRPNDEPIYAVYLRFRNSPRRKRSMKITAKWGDYDDIPSDITYLATALVGMAYDSPQRKGIKSKSIGRYSISFGEILKNAPMLQEILDMYRLPKAIL